ncbi:hypothetical protein [Frankia sp. Mgl5]|uniref:hypothetical protein n=1 Tax=Frankia sp. Mgl5 TaxID=2933793 RepID=UPI00200FE90C|nr:hypothetical protein [Frankia sp. Mgl5]
MPTTLPMSCTSPKPASGGYAEVGSGVGTGTGEGEGGRLVPTTGDGLEVSDVDSGEALPPESLEQPANMMTATTIAPSRLDRPTILRLLKVKGRQPIVKDLIAS